jgi:uncharacterized membrane protein YjgN (DUF898 family)
VIGLALKIFLFSIVTLTLYRFWGRTEVRRYLWSHIDVNGEPIEYTGTGRELFLGFLVVVFLIILPLVLAGYAIELFLERGSPNQIAAFGGLQAVLFLLYVAGIYQAWRYRLSRTVWRGVRMALGGSALAFSVRIMLLNVANIALLGWLTPVVDIAFLRMIARNAWYGDRRLDFIAKARRLYGPFATSYALGLLLLALLTFVMGLVMPALKVDTQGANGPPDPQAIAALLPIAAVAVLSGLILLLIASVFYRARRLQIAGSGFRLGELSFRLETGFWSYLRLTLGNLLIVLLTLGFGIPIAELRTFRYIFRRIEIDGTLDFAAIGPSAGPRPRIGEGLAEAFGLGNV